MQKFTPILGDFVPLATLWKPADDDCPPLFPSEHSARWFLRQHRAALVEADALASFTRELLVHPARVKEVVMRIALQRVRG
jgi:hypothetical protein